MRINNISNNNTNFNGLLRFQTSSGTRKLINPSKIAAVITGTMTVKQFYYEARYKQQENHNTQKLTNLSPKGRDASFITEVERCDNITFEINQISYIDPKIGQPNTYQKYSYRDPNIELEEHEGNIDLVEIEGNDFVIINENRLAEAIYEATTTDKIVDITNECGEVPWDGIFAHKKTYAPLVINNKVVMNTYDVARAYMASAEGLALAEEEIGAKNVLRLNHDDMLCWGRQIIEKEKERLSQAKTKADKIDRIEKIVKQYNNDDDDNAYLENADKYIDTLGLTSDY